eukprot:9304124-Alexandrium_andersonii.AAC.1
MAESAAQMRTVLALTTFDLFEAFGKVVRPLALSVVAVAGWLAGPLRAYAVLRVSSHGGEQLCFRRWAGAPEGPL